MTQPVFVGSAFVAQYPWGGGSFWLPVQYLLGLRALGIDAWWHEVLWTRGDHARDRTFIDEFLAHLGTLGIADRVVLQYFPDSGKDDVPGRCELIGMDAVELAARQRDALLINMADSITAPLRAAYGRTALYDIDPGAFQLWAREWGMGVGGHDVHVTIGQNLGAPDSPIPLDDVSWVRVWPAVHLPAWPVQPAPAPGAAYTTVTQWWNNQYAFLDGDTYDCNKRSGFIPIMPLPGRARVAMELAANVHPDEAEDRALLARNAWRLVDPAVVAGTPDTFRRYVQQSRGEFSAAKPAYVKARAGWISDRTICYLASGRPCVVEANGAEAHLPSCRGLRFFTTLDDAVDAVRAIEDDYEAAAREARAIAEDVFAAAVVLPGLLAAAGA
ncbi:MAG TPA: hypothetical protein VGR62_14615 [Candidatus Binatia bacterium]|jgi:hypothetical protein|nr:hypothetical protein [Candidatus Binatia bacterium]